MSAQLPSDGGDVLWRPPGDEVPPCRMEQYIAWLKEHRGLDFDGYDALWRWSVTDLGAFWGSLADYMGVIFHDPPTAVLPDSKMPGTVWFPGATLNFAEHALTGPEDAVVVISLSEARDRIEMTRGELNAQVASVRAAFERAGVSAGDRVAAYMPNIPETLVVLLAAACLGAVFTCCAPESGTAMVIGKIGQVEPSVLVTVDGYVYGGAPFDRVSEVAAIRRAVPSIKTTITVPYLTPGECRIPDSTNWNDVVGEGAAPHFAHVAFDHPLYIVYSSGTTGKPKPIVLGHGGILLEHLKLFLLHDDLGTDDRYFWYSSTNWMAWNYSVSALLSGGSVLTYDGHPMRPTLETYWQRIGEEGVTYLGTSPGFMNVCRKAGVTPREVADLTSLRTVNSGGAPLAPDGWRWVYEAVKSDVYLMSASGGTDVASSFVGGCRLLPVRAGEIACRLLGVDAKAYSEDGVPMVGETGELVICKPMPSMPVGFWGDDDGLRLFESYFTRFPGVWCHGDWVSFTSYGTCKVTGRSDATLNRGGVRLGTSDFYAVIDEVDDITDSLVVHLEDDHDGPGELILFLSVRDGRPLSAQVRDHIMALLREQLSPRHVPDIVRVVRSIPRTLSGKRQEVPVKRILLDPEGFAGTPDEAEALDEFRRLGRERASSGMRLQDSTSF